MGGDGGGHDPVVQTGARRRPRRARARWRRARRAVAGGGEPEADVTLAATVPAVEDAALEPLRTYVRGHATGGPVHSRRCFPPPTSKRSETARSSPGTWMSTTPSSGAGRPRKNRPAPATSTPSTSTAPLRQPPCRSPAARTRSLTSSCRTAPTQPAHRQPRTANGVRSLLSPHVSPLVNTADTTCPVLNCRAAPYSLPARDAAQPTERADAKREPATEPHVC